MWGSKTLVILLAVCAAMSSVGVAYACFGNVGYSPAKYDFKISSVSTADSAGSSKYLKAYIFCQDIFWAINNAYPGQVVYLRFNIQNTSNKPLKMDSFKVSTTSNIAFTTTTTYSKQTINPGETIKAEVKLTITKVPMKLFGLFTIRINVLGV
jgi:hypothetical protein